MLKFDKFISLNSLSRDGKININPDSYNRTLGGYSLQWEDWYRNKELRDIAIAEAKKINFPGIAFFSDDHNTSVVLATGNDSGLWPEFILFNTKKGSTWEGFVPNTLPNPMTENLTKIGLDYSYGKVMITGEEQILWEVTND